MLALLGVVDLRRTQQRQVTHVGQRADVQHVVVGQLLEPGKSCRIEYRGTGWTAINVGKESIAAGGEARIDSIDGLTLHVRAL